MRWGSAWARSRAPTAVPVPFVGFEVQHERRDRDAVADERDRTRDPHPPEHAVARAARCDAERRHSSPCSCVVGRRRRRPAVRNRNRPSVTGSASPSRAASNARIRRSASSAMRCASARPSGVSRISRSETTSTRSPRAADPSGALGGGGRARRRSAWCIAACVPARGIDVDPAPPRAPRRAARARLAPVDRLRDGPARPGPAAGDGTGRSRTGSRAARRAPTRRAALAEAAPACGAGWDGRGRASSRRRSAAAGGSAASGSRHPPKIQRFL